MTGDISQPKSVTPARASSPEDPSAWRLLGQLPAASSQQGLSLPAMEESWGAVVARGQTLTVEGTNVVRVPFGVRQPRRSRPARPDHWATLVLPFQPGSSPTPPPRAA